MFDLDLKFDPEEVDSVRSRPVVDRFSVEEEGDKERSMRCCLIRMQSLPREAGKKMKMVICITF